MHLLGLLQQARPVLLLLLFLAQHHVDATRRVMGLGVLDIDLRVQLEVDLVFDLLCFARAGEGYAGGGEVELCGGGGDVWDGEGHEEDVLFSFGRGGALGPEDCTASVRSLLMKHVAVHYTSSCGEAHLQE